MRIALYHNLTSGGSKREAYELSRQLVKNGHTVQAFLPSTANEEYLPLAPVIQKVNTYTLDEIKPIKYRIPGLRKYFDFFLLLINAHRLDRMTKIIAKEIDGGGFDFAFAHNDRIVQSPYILNYLNSPSFFFCAEINRGVYEQPLDRPTEYPGGYVDRFQRRWYSPIPAWLKAFVSRADFNNIMHANFLMTNSFFTKEAIRRAYNLQADVIYLGVDPEVFRPIKADKQPFVLSVGAITPLKGFDFLIKSLAWLPGDLRPKLILVGNSVNLSELNFLKAQASNKAIDLEIFTNVSDSKLCELYNQALAFVYAPHLEPFGLAPLEAMACGLPVIAVKEGGVRESVVDGTTGFLTDREPEEFASKLETILSSSNQRETMGHNARMLILEKWTWEHAYARFIKTVDKRLHPVKSSHSQIH